MKINLPKTVSDRIATALFSPVFAFFIAVPILILRDWQTDTLLLHLVKALSIEILSAFVVVFLLLFIYAIFAPRWVRSLMGQYAPTAITGSTIIIIGLGISIMGFFGFEFVMHIQGLRPGP